MRASIILLVVFGCAVLAGAQEKPAAAGDKEWEVSGVVRTSAGPVKDIWMSMTGPEQLRRPVRTDSQGRYSFKGSLPGTYTIRMQKPEDASEAKTRTITLSAGDQVKNFDLVIPKGAVIAGKVTDRSGRPVTGMVVLAYVRWYAQGRLRLSEKGGALSDDKGEYRIAHLPDGAYLIAAVPVIRKPLRAAQRQTEPSRPLAPAYPPVTFAPSGRSLAAAAVIEVRDGAEQQGVDISMEKEPVYCIYFRPMAAIPTSDEDFRLGTSLTEWLGTRGPLASGGSVRPGEDAQICGVPEGEYRLNLFGYIRQKMKGLGSGIATAVVDKRHVDIGAVEVLGFQRLTGRVTVRGARPDEPVPAGIRIVLDLWNRTLLPSDSLQGKVERDGAFNIVQVYQDTYGLKVENLPRGHYILKAQQDGQDIHTNGMRSGGGPVQIELASDGPVLSGKVLTEGDEPKPIPEATVFLVPSRGEDIRIAQSDQSGAYSFDTAVEPGEYKVVAVRDLMESERRDGRVAARYLTLAASVKLDAGERAFKDLTVR